MPPIPVDGAPALRLATADFRRVALSADAIGSRLVLDRDIDPIIKVLGHQPAAETTTTVAPDPPVADGRSYPVQGVAEPRCRPYLRVVEEQGPYLAGPKLRFERRDTGVFLTVGLEEDRSQRVAGAVPFDVRMTSLALAYGEGRAQRLEFATLLVTPSSDPAGPAFRVEAEAKVPVDRQEQIVRDLQGPARAEFVATMELDWVPPAPAPMPEPQVLEVFEPQFEVFEASPLAERKRILLERRQALQAERLRRIRIARAARAASRPRTIGIERRWIADYPDSGRNAPVYAGVNGSFAGTRWLTSQHGWFQPTPLRDTVYCLPDAYRLHVDEDRGLPSIQAVLLRTDSGPLEDDLDAASYTTRLTLKARPYFAPGRLAKLREFIRRQSTDTIKYADLAIGGYRSARFVADDTLAGLGELFAGTTAGDRETIDPAGGFSVTYEGNAEFIDLIHTRLKNEGIGGEVEFVLDEPEADPRRVRVPVLLSLRKLASLVLPVELVSSPPAPAPAEASANGDGPGAMPAVEPALTGFSVRNPTPRPVTIGGVQATALQRSPVTGSVYQAFPAKAEPALAQLTLEPGAETTIALGTDPVEAAWNAWDLELTDARPVLSEQLVLSELFDAATSGVRGWKVAVDCPPLQFFDRLKPEEQAALADVVRIEVEIRRPGSGEVEEARLTRDRPESHVLLSRTVADFLADRATGRSKFEWRRRLLRAASSDPWSEWHEETGNGLSVYTA
ncbi:MAG TPA: hypothetical protein VN213_16920 [Solirubrobacteraceae bacterium]|nr:hypothetical protein [Solirubrobacteraceae bacterium]